MSNVSNDQKYYYPRNDSYLYYEQYYRYIPPIDVSLFNKSAREARIVLQDVNKVISTLAESQEFDKKVMTAARDSKYDEVKRLINSLGISSDIDVKFSPSSMKIDFSPKANDSKIINIEIIFRWG